MCGAASLAMVYSAFGIKRTQIEIWNDNKSPDGNGGQFIKTYKLCCDALRYGLGSVTIRAKDPLAFLELCKKERDIKIIINQRPKAESTLGHFTVLENMTHTHIILHDPDDKPYRRIEKSHMLELLRPNGGDCKITGNILIAFSNIPSNKNSCSSCGTMIPYSTFCRNCHKEIKLQPIVVLGCAKETCLKRTWQEIICPHCNEGQRELTA